jgi:hypothetical protein
MKRKAVRTQVFCILLINLVSATGLVFYIESAHTHPIPITLYSGLSLLVVSLPYVLNAFIIGCEKKIGRTYTWISDSSTHVDST